MACVGTVRRPDVFSFRIIPVRAAAQHGGKARDIHTDQLRQHVLGICQLLPRGRKANRPGGCIQRVVHGFRRGAGFRRAYAQQPGLPGLYAFEALPGQAYLCALTRELCVGNGELKAEDRTVFVIQCREHSRIAAGIPRHGAHRQTFAGRTGNGDGDFILLSIIQCRC